MSVEGHRAADGEDMQAFMNALSPGYFKTMEIPFLEGRDFDADATSRRTRTWRLSIAASPSISSRARAPSANVSGGALGKSRSSTIEIIGVVADSLYEGPREGVRRQVFVPHFGTGSAAFYVRTTIRLGGRVRPASAAN